MTRPATHVLLAGYEAWNRRDLDASLAMCHRDIEWTFDDAAQFPGTDPVYRGHDGLRAFWSTFLEPWPELQVEVEDVHETPGGRVLFEVRFHAVASGSGIVFDQRFFHVLESRDGLLYRFHAYGDREKAFAAAGLD